MYKYLPDYITKSVFDMDLEKLRKQGVKGLAIDIDNTLVPMSAKTPDEKAKLWIKKAKDMGFKVCILSNSRKHRTRLFMDELGIHGIGFARKPIKKGYLKAALHMGLEPEECAILGDQIFTDIKGGAKAGFVTVLTEALDSREILWVRLKRIFQNRIINRNREGIEKI